MLSLLRGRLMRTLSLHPAPAMPAAMAPCCSPAAPPLRHLEAWRAHSTRPGADTRYAIPMEIVLQSRAALRSRIPTMLVKVVGVSFEGRQSAVSQLRPGQGLCFAKEPDNEYDPNAVAVTTLDETQLGYVPRDQTSPFPFSLCFGSVHSVGQAVEGGNWGLSAEVQPALPPMAVLALPTNLHGATRVAPLLRCDTWAQVQARVLETGGQRCAISGAGAPTVTERWAFDEREGMLRLLGFAALAPEVVRMQHMLESGEDLVAELQAMNAWDGADVDRYLAHVAVVQGRRSERPWRLDLRVLAEMGLQVPGELVSYVA